MNEIDLKTESLIELLEQSLADLDAEIKRFELHVGDQPRVVLLPYMNSQELSEQKKLA